MVNTKVIELAQQSGPLGEFAGYADLGIVVVFLVLFFSGKVRREGEVKERDRDIEALKGTLKEYTEHYQKEVLPALIEVTRVSGEIVSYLNKRRD